MNELIKIDFDACQINFDNDRSVDLVRITGNIIDRAIVKPKSLMNQRVDYHHNQIPAVFRIETPTISPAPSPSRGLSFKSNQRIKRGKVFLAIPEFAVSKILRLDGGRAQRNASKGLPCSTPSDAHVNLVVGAIKGKQCDKFRKSDVTFSLRNKGVKAKDIQAALEILVYQYGALQLVENINANSPSLGRNPSQEYQVLWGESQFFPAKHEATDGEE